VTMRAVAQATDGGYVLTGTTTSFNDASRPETFAIKLDQQGRLTDCTEIPFSFEEVTLSTTNLTGVLQVADVSLSSVDNSVNLFSRTLTDRSTSLSTEERCYAAPFSTPIDGSITETPNSEKSDQNAAAIAGGVSAAVAFLGIVAMVVFLFIKKKACFKPRSSSLGAERGSSPSLSLGLFSPEQAAAAQQQPVTPSANSRGAGGDN
jgi:hypothetical protein